jgi:hypothetical protein
MRLLSFLINVPSKYYYYNGQQKYLFRKIFDGRVSAEILNNDFTIQQSFDLGQRILSEPFFKNYLDRLDENQTSVININALKQNYLEIKSEKTGLRKYVTAMKFLKNFSIVYIYNAYVKIQR